MCVVRSTSKSILPNVIDRCESRVTGPYLGQVAPVAVLTARERARGVYSGVFGRAVLATLPIGLPRPILLRAADIGPTVKSHCLFPPPLREPNGHATYTGDTRTCVSVVTVCSSASVLFNMNVYIRCCLYSVPFTVSHSTMCLMLSNSETELLRYVTIFDPEFARDGEFAWLEIIILLNNLGSIVWSNNTWEWKKRHVRNFASRYRQRLAIPGRPTRTARKKRAKNKNRIEIIGYSRDRKFLWRNERTIANFTHAPPTVGAPLVATPSEAPSHESALLFSRLSRWMMTVIFDGHRGHVVVPVVRSVVPTSTAGHWYRTSRMVVVPLPYSRSKTFSFPLLSFSAIRLTVTSLTLFSTISFIPIYLSFTSKSLCFLNFQPLI